jgi:acrylyl-CoA reductase (NADPH)
MCPRDVRIAAWDRLSRDLPLDRLDAMTETVPLSKLSEIAPRILAGDVRGRTVIDVPA